MTYVYYSAHCKHAYDARAICAAYDVTWASADGSVSPCYVFNPHRASPTSAAKKRKYDEDQQKTATTATTTPQTTTTTTATATITVLPISDRIANISKS